MVAIVALLPFTSIGQLYEECGTEMTTEDFQRIQSALSQSMQYKDRTPADSTVPVKFHIIRYNNGAGIDSADVFNELALVNSFYANAGIKFFHCGNVNYIDNTLYTNFEKVISETICDIHDQPNVLNIYFAPNVFRVTNGSTVQLCGYAYSSSLTKNRIVMANNCSTNGSTLAHEIGHYFSLAHTHQGNGSELVNGSNCTSAGDQLCDTPADPGLSTLTVSNSCQYTGNQTDANNQVYAPNVRNIMSYSRKSCRTEFSTGQYNRMNAYFFAFRNYLTCAPVSTNNILLNKAVHVYPNPSTGLFSIQSPYQVTAIKLIDQTGRLVYQVIGANIFTTVVNISTLSDGLYFYEINTTQGIAKGKILKK